MSKEDMWMSRVPVPVRWEVEGDVHDDFSRMKTGGVVEGWNIYSPKWCGVEVVEFPGNAEKSMRMKDGDGCDYAKAVRVFEKAAKVRVSFDMYIGSAGEEYAIEIVSGMGGRLVQSRVSDGSELMVRDGGESYAGRCKLDKGRWYTVTYMVDAEKGEYSVLVDGESVVDGAGLSAEGMAERIVFRTGRYRLTDDVQKYKSGSEDVPGWDEPGADEPVEEAVYYIKGFEAVGMGK